MTEAYIVAAVRTAGGRRNGRLASWHPVDLGAAVVDELVRRAGADPVLVEDVIFGCVSQAGEQSTNVGRNVVLASGLPRTVPGTSVDRQCGSSQQAIHFAAQDVMSGAMDVVAGAGESVRRPGLNGGAQSMTVLHSAAAPAGERDRFLLEPLG
jgi:acetyl-CoA C-acetyltransferase